MVEEAPEYGTRHSNLLFGLFVRKSQQKHIGSGESFRTSRLFPH